MTEIRMENLQHIQQTELKSPFITINGEKHLKVLIVDDEPTVHDITALILKDFKYQGYKLHLVSAYSGSEAREILASQGPFTLILLDVIMETDDAGLKIVDYIRNELGDSMVRIILRTGQPGSVPQHHIMRKYEIDDYKEKAELTSERFDAAVTASIRTYLTLRNLKKHQEGLMKVIESIQEINKLEYGITNLYGNIINQFEQILGWTDKNTFGSMLIVGKEGLEKVEAARGLLEEYRGQELEEIYDTEIIELVKKSIRDNKSEIHSKEHVCVTITVLTGVNYIIVLKKQEPFDDFERYLIRLLISHLKVFLDNRILNDDLLSTHIEIISTLGEVIETRSEETGQHVQRMGEIAQIISSDTEMNETESDLLCYAAPLHDIGKVGIPDKILNKPGKLTPEEYEIIKKHSDIGFKILKKSNRPLFQLGAKICLEHHEWWNGNGYPNGLKGKQISLEARICAIADVFDAVCSDRVYKKAVPVEEAFEIVEKGSGTHFDPSLVNILLKNKEKIEAIYKI